MRGKAWQAVIGGCAVLAAPSVLMPGSPVALAAYLAGLAVVATGLVAAARSLTPPQRRAWVPWIAGVGCAITGSAVQQIGFRIGSHTLDHVALMIWVVLYVPYTLAVVRMIEARALPVTARRAIAKDVAVVTAAATVFAWYLLIEPSLDGAPTADWWTLTTAYAYPLGDVVTVALSLTLVLAPGRRTAAENMIVLGLGVSLVLDIMNALLPMAGFTATAWYMSAYLLVNAVLTAAALHPSRALATEPPVRAVAVPGMRGWRMVLLGGALCGVGLSAILIPYEGWQQLPAGAAMIAMIAVILSRLHTAVTDLERAERTLRHEATHDQLTGLANRARLMDDMRHMVSRAPTLFFVDLDGFKAVNDTRGHHSGDLVLQSVAQRLRATVRSTDTVARLGGDEFVVLCTGLTEADVASLADRIERAMAAPIDAGGSPITVGASIGILTLPAVAAGDEQATEDLISDLLRVADAAMYEAKRAGGGTKVVAYA